METTRTFDPLDISSHAFWAQPPAVRDERFARLRAERPVSWHRPAETDLMPNSEDPGFWALTRHADIVEASRNAEVFASGQEFGGVMLEDVPAEVLEAAHSILAMDAPRHVPPAPADQLGVHPEAGGPDRGADPQPGPADRGRCGPAG